MQNSISFQLQPMISSLASLTNIKPLSSMPQTFYSTCGFALAFSAFRLSRSEENILPGTKSTCGILRLHPTLDPLALSEHYFLEAPLLFEPQN